MIIVQDQKRFVRLIIYSIISSPAAAAAALLVALLLFSTITLAFHLPTTCVAVGMGKRATISTSKCLISSSSSSSSTLDTIHSVQGILFDVDGTLADSWKLGFDATQVVLQNNGIELITEEVYHDHTRFCTPDRLARHAGYVPEDGQHFKTIGQRLGKEFDELYVNLVSTETAGFYKGIHPLLDFFPSHIKLGALTNACVAYAEAVLRVNDNIQHRFMSVHGADSIPAPKPNPDGLLVCCKEMGLEPSTCVYIGDSPSDAMAAQAAGMPSIGVLWGSHSKESLQKAPFLHLCSTVDELQSLLPRR